MANNPNHLDSSDFMLADEIDELFGGANPNPDRIGCPAREVLSLLSRRERPIDDPAYEHLASCSPCYQEFRALQLGRGSPRGLSRPSRIRWVAAIAAVLVFVAVATWLYFRPSGSVPPREPVVAELRVELDLRRFTVPRSPQEQGTRPPLELPRGQLVVTMFLPAGSESGAYDVELLDASSRPQASTSGQAEIRSFITTLDARLDLRATAPGEYQLALRRPGEDWRRYPATVR
jgi:hypothetical protein